MQTCLCLGSILINKPSFYWNLCLSELFAHIYPDFGTCMLQKVYKPGHEISNNVRPAMTQTSLRKLIRAFACRLNIL